MHQLQDTKELTLELEVTREDSFEPEKLPEDPRGTLPTFPRLSAVEEETLSRKTSTSFLSQALTSSFVSHHEAPIPEAPETSTTPTVNDGSTLDKNVFYTAIRRMGGERLGMGLGFSEGYVVVTQVDAGLPAHLAKIVVGDVLLSINGTPVTPGAARTS